MAGQLRKQYQIKKMISIKTCLRILNITDLQEADEDGGGGLDMDEFRQAMIKTMAGKGEVVRHKLHNSIFLLYD